MTTEEIRENVAALIFDHHEKILSTFLKAKEREPLPVMVVLWDCPTSVVSVGWAGVHDLISNLPKLGAEKIIPDITKSACGPNFSRGVPVYCRMCIKDDHFHDYFAVVCPQFLIHGPKAHGNN